MLDPFATLLRYEEPSSDLEHRRIVRLQVVLCYKGDVKQTGEVAHHLTLDAIHAHPVSLLNLLFTFRLKVD